MGRSMLRALDVHPAFQVIGAIAGAETWIPSICGATS